MGLGPFDLTGGPFLLVYGILFAAAAIASLTMPIWSRPDGRPGRIDAADELAYLAGGTVRMAEAAMVRLLVAGAIAQERRQRFRTKIPNAGTTPAERTILGAAQPAKWRDLVRGLSGYSQEVERRLANKGLFMDPGQVLRQRIVNSVPLIVLLLFGSIKLLIGESRGRPVGYLTTFLVITAAFAIARFFTVDRRTRSAYKLLADESAKAERLSRAPASEEMGMAVALFGTAVLAGSVLSEFYKMRRNDTDGGESGNGAGGGGGDGGCGGCGGD